MSFSPKARFVGRKAVTAGLAMALTLGTCIPVAHADTASDLAAASQRLESLGAELSSLESDLENKTADLELTSYEIGQKQNEIDQTQSRLDQKRAELGEQVKSNYISGPVNWLSVLLGSTSFDDLSNRIYYADKVSQSQSDAINEVKSLGDQLSTQKGELESKQAEQQSAVNEMESQVAVYQSKVADAQAWYSSLDAQVQQELAAQAAAQSAGGTPSNADAALNAVTDTSAPSNANNADNGSNSAPSNATNDDDNGSDNGSHAQNNNSNNSNNDSHSNNSSNTAHGGASGGGLGTAYSMIGVPYKWGGTSADGVDCSGLVCHCYGFARGRTTYDMIDSLKASGDWKTSVDQLQAGDLVFPHSGHVGIYIGNNQMIHAPSPGRTVCITTLYGFYGGGTY